MYTFALSCLEMELNSTNYLTITPVVLTYLDMRQHMINHHVACLLSSSWWLAFTQGQSNLWLQEYVVLIEI